MKKAWKRLFALFLVLGMILNLSGVGVLAAEPIAGAEAEEAFTGDAGGGTDSEPKEELPAEELTADEISAYAGQTQRTEQEDISEGLSIEMDSVLAEQQEVNALSEEPAGQEEPVPWEQVAEESSFDEEMLVGNSVVIGDPESEDTRKDLPFNIYYKNSASQQIILAQEIGSRGTITSLSFERKRGTESLTREIEIYLCHTGRDVFDGSSDWVAMQDDCLVYSGSLDIPENAGTITVTLTKPFDYNGIDNLLVCFCSKWDSYKDGHYFSATKTTGARRAVLAYSDSSSFDVKTLTDSNGNDVSKWSNLALAECHTNLVIGIDPSSAEPVDVSGMTITPGSLEMNYGDVAAITVNPVPGDATDKFSSWSVAQEGTVAELYQDEKCRHLLNENDRTNTVYVKCKGKGSATVTVTSRDNPAISASCIITGLNEPEVEDGYIGDPETGSESQHLPGYSFYNYSLSQQIFLAGECKAPGIISSLTFYKKEGGERTRTVDIYMCHTNKNAFEGNYDWVNMTENDLVYRGSVTYPNDAGAVAITLDKPFNYNGTDNLLLCFYDKTGSYQGSPPFFLVTDTEDYRAIAAYTDNDPGYDVGNLSGIQVKQRYNLRNNVSLGFVTNLADVEGLTVTPESCAPGVNDVQAITASLTPDNAADKSVIWSVSPETGVVELYKDAECATPVGGDATDALTVYAKCVGAGSATVTAVSNSNSDAVASCALTVQQEAQPEFKTYSVTLGAQIGLNFFIDLPEIDGVSYEDSYMDFSVAHGKAPDRKSINTTASGKNAAGYYKFTADLNVAQMAEPVTAVFHYKKNGEDRSLTYTRSVKDYVVAFNRVRDQAQYSGAAGLVDTLADYGHYAQLYLADENHWTYGADYAAMDVFASDPYSAEQIQSAKNGLAGYDVKITNNAFNKFTMSLALDSKTSFKLHAYPKEGYEGNVTASVEGNRVKVRKESDGSYYITVLGIAAHQLGSELSIDIVTDGEDAGEHTIVEASALYYVKNMLDQAGEDQVHKRDAMVAIYRYYEAARNYQNGQ